MAIPATQYAVQLVGPDELTLNTSKPVVHPGPHQILAKIECVGLCFSDLKLLNQFSGHARKSEIVDGLAKEILAPRHLHQLRHPVARCHQRIDPFDAGDTWAMTGLVLLCFDGVHPC